jgi:hypothetical protein
VKPGHLEPVTHKVNTLRGTAPTAVNAAKTHCLRGHALEGDNLVPFQLSIGQRACRTCHNARQRAYDSGQRAKAID